jgi:hypothetical protein
MRDNSTASFHKKHPNMSKPTSYVKTYIIPSVENNVYGHSFEEVYSISVEHPKERGK